MSESQFEVNDLDYLYSTNAVPNAVDAARIRRQVGILRGSISQLRSQLHDQEAQLLKHCGVISPVRQVPAEVLSEIFTFVLPCMLNEEERTHLLNLALVCRNWRNAVLLTHQLWSGITLVPSIDPLPAEICRKVTDWLGRSGNVPRTLKFVCPISNFWGCNRCVCVIEGSRCKHSAAPVARLLASGPSLHHLSFDFDGLQCFRNVVEALESSEAGVEQRPWDTIKKFTLKLRSRSDDTHPPSESIYKHLPPSITSFHLTLPNAWNTNRDDEWALQDIFYTMPLPIPSNFLERLTALFISCNWPGRQLFDVLQKCVNVLTLTIDLQKEDPQYELNDQFFVNLSNVPLLLPEVRTLRMSRFFPTAIFVLGFLRAPRLVVLDLSFVGRSEPLDHTVIQTIKAFLLESECEKTFQSFCLAKADMKPKKLISLLRGALKLVVHLTLEEVSLTNTLNDGYWIFYEFLSSPDNLPQLETLQLLLLPYGSHLGLLDSIWVRQPLEICDGKSIFPNERLGASLIRKLVITFEQSGIPPPPEPLFDSDVLDMIQKWRRYAHMLVSIGPVR